MAHLLHAIGRDLDWDRLLRRFGPHWRVLMAHLVLFGYIYPSDRTRIPDRVFLELVEPAFGDRASRRRPTRSARGPCSRASSTSWTSIAGAWRTDAWSHAVP